MLLDLLIAAAQRRGASDAVADPRVQLTYARLVRFARVLRQAILRGSPAPRIGVLLPTCAAFSGAFFATLWARRTVVPLNFLLMPEELRPIVVAAELDLVITLKPFAKLVETLPVRPMYLEDLPMRRRMLATYLAPRPQVPELDADETAVLLFTSGTSAAPKGVELTHRNLATNATACVQTGGITSAHRFLSCLPPFHVFGLTANVIAPVVAGASVYCVPRFSPQAVVRAVRDRQIAVLMAIPSMFAAILRLKSVSAQALATLELAVSGGEPLPETVAAGFLDRFGIRLLQGYGLTETSPVCTLEVPAACRDGSIGRPVPGVEVRIVDEQGTEVPPGTAGELWVRGPNVMKGYYGDPAATQRVISPDGWFRTGDMGRIDEDGYVFLTGRIKDMIIVAGENVFPREIEAVLEQHDAVAEASVIGIDDPRRGELPVAFVILHEGAAATEADLRAFCRDRLAGYKVPRQVHFAADLPRGPTGKILKRKLRDGAAIGGDLSAGG